MNNTKVIIIGSTHHNMYSMLRCFGESGFLPIAIIYGCEDSYIAHSVFCNEIYIVKDETAALQLLINNKDKWCEYCIISCTDAISSSLDLNFEALSGYYHFFNCGQQGSLTRNMNKLYQTKLAKQVYFDVPDSVEGLISEVLDCSINYPRIIKPVESIHGGKQIEICYDKSQYKQSLSAFSTDEKVIVQEFIEKEYEIVVVGLSVNGNTYIPAYIHKHRDTKGGTTYSTVKTISELPINVIEACKAMSSKMQYEGLWGIELIKKNDSYYFVEMNLRNDATTYAINVAGVNLPLMYYQIKSGLMTGAPSMQIREIHSIVEFPDFIHVLKGEVNTLTWWKQLRNAECRYLYSPNDKDAYRNNKCQFLKMLRRRILKF